MLHPPFHKGFKRISNWENLGEALYKSLIYLSYHGTKITVNGVIKRCLHLGRKVMTNLDNILIKQRHHFANKGLCSQSYGFSSSHVQVWELDHKEAEGHRIDAFKLWCWRRLLKSPLDSKEIKSVNPKGNQPWIFIGRIDTKAEAPVLWPPDLKNWFIGKDCAAGNDWGQEEKGATEDEMVGWHHWLNGHEFEQTLGDSAGQGSLVCCSLWGHKESDMT